MQTGLKVSLAGHVLLLAVALVGWPFGRAGDPVPLAAVTVSLVSSDDLPLPGADVPPQAPETGDAVAALPAPPGPDVPAEPPPSREDGTAPETAPPPPAVDRVAPVPQPAPPEDLPEADAPQTAVAPVPDPTAEAVDAEPREAQAPRAAAPQIVTEATETSDAPIAAIRPDLRPQARPARPVQDPEPAPQDDAAPPDPVSEDAVAAALAEALAGAPQAGDPLAPRGAGPPLSAGQRDGLRIAVGRCWNYGALSTDAAQVTVVVGMDMARDGSPSNLRLVSHSGGGEAAARQAFETARRAILRCQPFDLPAASYDQWRRIEMTFNPDEMRRR